MHQLLPIIQHGWNSMQPPASQQKAHPRPRRHEEKLARVVLQKGETPPTQRRYHMPVPVSFREKAISDDSNVPTLS